MKHANPKPSSKDQIKFFSATAFAAIIITVSYLIGVPHYFLGWMAFSVAAFSVAGNDAIQTVGTFIESKRKTHWVPKVVMLCGLLIVVHASVFRDAPRQQCHPSLRSNHQLLSR